MQPQNLSLPKTLNPYLNPFPFFPYKFCNLPRIPHSSAAHKPIKIFFQIPNPKSSGQNATRRPDVRSFAGRNKGKSGGAIDGGAELLREAKRSARRRSKKIAESLFYRLKNPHKNYPDNFSEEDLQMIGLGYDRLVRFMEKDDPNLKHPYDWYKYGEFGPYSWRGVVLGDPIRGDFSDERVAMIGEVRDQEEWEKIEQHDMAREFQRRLDAMDKGKKVRYFWVFVRHPKWRVADPPWQQWTLVCETALEAGEQRLDKWTLMGRLGNKARAMITQCAAWMRPDIIYVKRPVYQCRFEPQEEFFQALAPLLDPETERDYMCEMVGDDGGVVEACTYFGGLCKMVRVNPKAFVDDVVNAYEKLSDESKSKCLEFLLGNHPVLLLHPYTKEWKARLEEMELGCDAPDDDDGVRGGKNVESEFEDWVEDDGNDEDEDEDDEDEDEDVVLDANDGGDDEVLGIQENESSEAEEDEKDWEEEFKKAMRSNEAMEKLVEKSIDVTDKYYESRMMGMQKKKETGGEEGDELEMRGKRAKVSKEEWRRLGYGPYRRRVKKSRIPPKLFLRAAVRPFTYRNLVKEIVLTRHAIVEGEINRKK